MGAIVTDLPQRNGVVIPPVPLDQPALIRGGPALIEGIPRAGTDLGFDVLPVAATRPRGFHVFAQLAAERIGRRIVALGWDPQVTPPAGLLLQQPAGENVGVPQA